MLGAAGCIIPESFNKYGANCGPEAVWLKTWALLLDGNTLNYFGKNIPINLVLAALLRLLLVVQNTTESSTNMTLAIQINGLDHFLNLGDAALPQPSASQDYPNESVNQFGKEGPSGDPAAQLKRPRRQVKIPKKLQD